MSEFRGMGGRHLVASSCLSRRVAGPLAVCAAALVAAACGDNIRGEPVNPNGTLQVAAVGSPATTEAGGEAQFEVVLTAQPVGPVTVAITTTNPLEASVPVPTLTFTTTNWDAPQIVIVRGLDDDRADGDQLYAVRFEAGETGRAELAAVNVDDDVIGFTVGPTTNLATSEAGNTAQFSVALTSQPTGAVTIPLASADPTEGTVAPASLTFTPDNWNSMQQVTVTGVDDALQDGNQLFRVVLGAATSVDTTYAGLDPDDVDVTNFDDDTANVFVTPTSGLETTESGGTDTFTIVLLTQPTAAVTIPLASSAPDEATVSDASVTFTPQNWNAPQEVTVTGAEDAIVDGAQPFTIAVGTATSTDAAYAGLDPTDVTGTNRDNDSAGIQVEAAAGLTTSEAGGEALFTVVLVAQPTAAVTIPLTSSDLTEGAVSPTALTFDATNWSTAQTVTVTGVDDALPDGNVVYSIAIGAAVSADPAYSGLTHPSVTLTNIDNEVAGITVTPTSDLVTSEFGDADTFEIVLNTQPTANVTIALSSSDTTEATVAPTSVTFTPFTWNVAQTATVTGQNDPDIDGDQPYTIVTGAAVSADVAYGGLNPADVTGVNIDDESPAVFVNTKKRVSIGENGQAGTFKMRLTTQPSADVICQLASSDLTEGTVPPTFTFTPQNYSLLRAVQITPVDDLIKDGDQLFTIIVGPCSSTDLGYDGFNPRDVPVVTRDNE